MPTFPITNWTKGMTDNYVGAGPGYSEKLHNLFISRIGKPFQRPGIDVLNELPQIPAGLQQIDSVYYFDSTIFVKSGTKLYYVDESDGDTNYTELDGPNADAFADSEVGAKCSWSDSKGHLYATPGPGPTGKEGCRTVKVYRNAAGVWTLVQAGLPRCVNDGTGLYQGPTYTVGGVSYQYTWWVVFYRTYDALVNGVVTTFEDIGAPLIYVDRGNKVANGGNDVWLGSFDYTNAAEDNYDTATMLARSYRTEANGLVPKLSAEISLGAQIIDSCEDDNLGVLGYAGLADANDNDPPPPCYFHTMTGATTWYFAGVDLDAEALRVNRVWQCKPGNNDGVPSGNFTDIEGGGVGTAFGRAGQFPIAFFRSRCYRIEGYLDQLGGGALRAVLISGIEGSVTQDIIPANGGIYFQSENGFCFTDGYKVYPMSNHLRQRFSELGTSPEYSSGCYDPFNKRVFFGVEDPNCSNANGSVNTAWVMDENWTHPGEGPNDLEGCFTTMSSDDDFRPTAMHYDTKNRRIIFGDEQGFLFTLNPDNWYDYQVDGATFTSLTTTKAIVYEYISAAYDFGDGVSTKWVSALYGTFKNLTGKLSLDMWSINDDQADVESLAMGAIREDVESESGLHKIKRRFPRGGLRCTYKQLRLKKGLVNLLRSDDYTLCAVTLDGAEGVCVLAGGDWPDGDDGTNLVGYQILFDTDAYATAYTILSNSGDTITVDNDGATLTADGSAKWLIRGYPKDQGVEIHSLAYDYEVLQDGEAVVAMGSDGGTNA